MFLLWSRSVSLETSMIVTKIHPVESFKVQVGCNHYLHFAVFSTFNIFLW